MPTSVHCVLFFAMTSQLKSLFSTRSPENRVPASAPDRESRIWAEISAGHHEKARLISLVRDQELGAREASTGHVSGTPVLSSPWGGSPVCTRC